MAGHAQAAQTQEKAHTDQEDDDDIFSDDSASPPRSSSHPPSFGHVADPSTADSTTPTSDGLDKAEGTDATAPKRAGRFFLGVEGHLDPELYGLRRSGRARQPVDRLPAGRMGESSGEEQHSRQQRRRGGRRSKHPSSEESEDAAPEGVEDGDEDTDGRGEEEEETDEDLGAYRSAKRKRSSAKRSSAAAKKRSIIIGYSRPPAAGARDDRYASRKAASRKAANARGRYRPMDSTEEEEEEEEDEASESDPGSGEEGAGAGIYRQLARATRKKTPLEQFQEAEQGMEEAIDGVFDYRPLPSGDGDPAEPGLEARDSLTQADFEYLVKWRGASHRHNTWEGVSRLRHLRGFRKVENFHRRVAEELAFRRAPSTTPDDLEQLDIRLEADRTALQEYRVVERVIAVRYVEGEEDTAVEYLCKWHHLPYRECTWESQGSITDHQAEIDAFLERNACVRVPHKSAAFARRRADYKPFQKQPAYFVGGELRDYQLLGINWMAHLWHRNENGILADEMGLGKHLFGPFLVVVPLSTMNAWQKEFRRWAPDMNLICYYGDSVSRAVLQEFEFCLPNPDGTNSSRLKFNVLLTSYELVLKDEALLGSIKWAYLAVDEAHRLKNAGSQLHEALTRFHTANRLLITGTPLQNSVKELLALVDFLMPDRFAEFRDFEIQVDGEQEQEDKIRDLQSKLKNYMLRRLKRDVEKSLPAKIERILRVELSPLQLVYYKAVFTKNFELLNKGAQRGQLNSLQNIAMELKKASNHPYLFEGAEVPAASREEQLMGIIKHAGKMVLLDKLLARLKQGGHRVLIFSQMVRMLDIISDFLTYRSYAFQRLDGSTNSETRNKAMEHFNAPDSTDFVFLLSTRAGGLGINLQTADTVILYDLDWNPQNDLQAIARSHRMGQKSIVNVYRFISKDTIEEEILERAKRKMVLEYAIIKQMDTSGESVMTAAQKKAASLLQANTSSTVSNEDLQNILKFGAQNLFKQPSGDATGAAAEEESKLEHLNLDDVLSRAELHQAAEETGTALGSAEFLEQFNVADVSTNAMSWEDIIPADQRPPPSTDETGEGRSAKDAASEWMLNGARRRAAATLATSYGQQDAGEAPAPKRRKAARRAKPEQPVTPGLEGLEGGSDEEPDLSAMFAEKETRALVRCLLKYGDWQRHFEAIVREADLGAKDPDFVRTTIRDLIRTCKAALAEASAAERSPEATPTGKPAGPHRPKMVPAEFNGVPQINAGQLLQRVGDLSFLGSRLRPLSEAPYAFRLTSWSIKPPDRWSVPWGVVEDSMLLVGMFMYGFGAWDRMQEDDALGLKGKFFLASADKTELPKAVHLVRRGDYLLRVFHEEEGEERRTGAPNRKNVTTTAAPGAAAAGIAASGAGAGAASASPASNGIRRVGSVPGPGEHHTVSSTAAATRGEVSRPRQSSYAGTPTPGKLASAPPLATEPLSSAPPSIPGPGRAAGGEDRARSAHERKHHLSRSELLDLLDPVRPNLRLLRSPPSDLAGGNKVMFIKENILIVGRRIQRMVDREPVGSARREVLEAQLWKLACEYWPVPIQAEQYRGIYIKVVEKASAPPTAR